MDFAKPAVLAPAFGGPRTKVLCLHPCLGMHAVETPRPAPPPHTHWCTGTRTFKTPPLPDEKCIVQQHTTGIFGYPALLDSLPLQAALTLNMPSKKWYVIDDVYLPIVFSGPLDLV